ncbi:MAG: NAD(P)-dependent alcohol dehydrogenase [Bauldia sp.]|nr:NAD(P)-dependent alcohol dehydrogenase [Bauldia sp.]
MKAWVSERYGGPEVMQLRDVPKPVPGPGAVLVKMVAASANAADWHVLRATPAFSRLTLGLFRPKNTIIGGDVAGTIEALGPGVTGYAVGDAVFGNTLDHNFGCYAEYVVVPVSVLARKPASVSFDDAAALPMAGVTALEGFRHHGPVRPGSRVLVNGASGGVGHFAVQLAKAFGAHVTGVTSTRNLDFVRALGADAVIDYTRTDFTKAGPFDRILDAVGNRSVRELRRALAPGGACAVTGFSSMGKLIGVGLRGGKAIRQINAKSTAANLAEIGALAEAGKLRPAIERRYGFGEVPEAIRALETTRVRGKLVIDCPTTGLRSASSRRPGEPARLDAK